MTERNATSKGRRKVAWVMAADREALLHEKRAAPLFLSVVAYESAVAAARRNIRQQR